MESRASNTKENDNEELEQDNKGEIENRKQGQDNSEKIDNDQPGQDMAVTVEEEAQPSDQQVEEHHDSPRPMLVDENTPVPSHSDNLPLDTNTEEDILLENNSETINATKTIRLEPSQCLEPSPLVSFTESLVEQNNKSVKHQTESSTGLDTVQVGVGLSTDNRDSVQANTDASAENGKTSIMLDEKPSTDHGRGSVMPDTEASVMHDKGPVEPDNETSADHDKGPVKHDTETVTEHGNGLDKPDTVISAENDKEVNPYTETSTDHEKGQVKPDTLRDHDKRIDMPGSETLTERGNESVKTATKTSTDHDPNTKISTDHDPNTKTSADHKNGIDMPGADTLTDHDKGTAKLGAESATDIKVEVPDSKVVSDACYNSSIYKDIHVDIEPAADGKKKDSSEPPRRKAGDTRNASTKHEDSEPGKPNVSSSDVKPEDGKGGELNNGVNKINTMPPTFDGALNSKHTFLMDDMSEGSESGTEEDQSAFMKELENFFRERSMEFKPPKFYGEGLNLLKLWRAVTRLGGYDKVTSCKLWRQVGESFRPPKTCTTVSWTFRGFYEKALLDYERHKTNGGELTIPIASHSEPMNIDNQASGSGRARRDAAARAMQGWHSQRLLGNGEVSDPIIKEKISIPVQKREKQLGNLGLLKRKRPSYIEHAAKAARSKVSKPQVDVAVIDVGPPANWVKINVQRTKDCYEVYALVPGLLREEVRVQSDPAGRLVISGEPEHPDNPWGATPFKKVVSLPSRIDPHQTSAVVTLNGQLFVRVPFEQSD